MTTDLYQRGLDKIMEYAPKDHPTVASHQKIVEMLNRKNLSHGPWGRFHLRCCDRQCWTNTEPKPHPRTTSGVGAIQDRRTYWSRTPEEIRHARFRHLHQSEVGAFQGKLIALTSWFTIRTVTPRRGSKTHIAELKPQFVFAPDTRIREHPVKIQSWRMDLGARLDGGDGLPADANAERAHRTYRAKKFKPLMSTVGHWKSGVMDEEFLFWDNASFMKQIGFGEVTCCASFRVCSGNARWSRNRVGRR